MRLALMRPNIIVEPVLRAEKAAGVFPRACVTRHGLALRAGPPISLAVRDRPRIFKPGAWLPAVPISV